MLPAGDDNGVGEGGATVEVYLISVFCSHGRKRRLPRLPPRRCRQRIRSAHDPLGAAPLLELAALKNVCRVQRDEIDEFLLFLTIIIRAAVARRSRGLREGEVSGVKAYVIKESARSISRGVPLLDSGRFVITSSGE